MDTKEFVVLRGLMPSSDGMAWTDKLHVDMDYFTFARGYHIFDFEEICELNVGEDYWIGVDGEHTIRRIA